MMRNFRFAPGTSYSPPVSAVTPQMRLSAFRAVQFRQSVPACSQGLGIPNAQSAGGSVLIHMASCLLMPSCFFYGRLFRTAFRPAPLQAALSDLLYHEPALRSVYGSPCLGPLPETSLPGEIPVHRRDLSETLFL